MHNPRCYSAMRWRLLHGLWVRLLLARAGLCGAAERAALQDHMAKAGRAHLGVSRHAEVHGGFVVAVNDHLPVVGQMTCTE